MHDIQDPLNLYDTAFSSRFLLGTALYPSPQSMLDAIASSGCNIVTLGLRRQNPSNRDGQAIWEAIQQTG